MDGWMAGWLGGWMGVMHPEGFSQEYTGMSAQIPAPKNKIYIYLHYYFVPQAIFLHFKSK